MYRRAGRRQKSVGLKSRLVVWHGDGRRHASSTRVQVGRKGGSSEYGDAAASGQGRDSTGRKLTSRFLAGGATFAALALAVTAFAVENVVKPLVTRHYVPAYLSRTEQGAGKDPKPGFALAAVLPIVKGGEWVIAFNGCLSCGGSKEDDIELLAHIASKYENALVLVVYDEADQQTFERVIAESALRNVRMVESDEATSLNLYFSPRLYIVDDQGQLKFVQKQPIAIQFYDSFLRGVVP